MLYLTFTNPFSEVIMASQTSGTILEIACFEIRNVYIRLVKDSPLARNRRVTASLTEAGMVSLNTVQSFEIFSPTICKRVSKSAGLILKKFLKPMPSSSFNFSRRFIATVMPPENRVLLQYRLGLRFFLFNNIKLFRHKLNAQRAISWDIAF